MMIGPSPCPRSAPALILLLVSAASAHAARAAAPAPVLHAELCAAWPWLSAGPVTQHGISDLMAPFSARYVKLPKVAGSSWNPALETALCDPLLTVNGVPPPRVKVFMGPTVPAGCGELRKLWARQVAGRPACGAGVRFNMTVVRNPWSRAVSVYNYVQPRSRTKSTMGSKPLPTFEEFASDPDVLLRDPDVVVSPAHWDQQLPALLRANMLGGQLTHAVPMEMLDDGMREFLTDVQRAAPPDLAPLVRIPTQLPRVNEGGSTRLHRRAKPYTRSSARAPADDARFDELVRALYPLDTALLAYSAQQPARSPPNRSAILANLGACGFGAAVPVQRAVGCRLLARTGEGVPPLPTASDLARGGSGGRTVLAVAQPADEALELACADTPPRPFLKPQASAPARAPTTQSHSGRARPRPRGRVDADRRAKLRSARLPRPVPSTRGGHLHRRALQPTPVVPSPAAAPGLASQAVPAGARQRAGAGCAARLHAALALSSAELLTRAQTDALGAELASSTERSPLVAHIVVSPVRRLRGLYRFMRAHVPEMRAPVRTGRAGSGRVWQPSDLSSFKAFADAVALDTQGVLVALRRAIARAGLPTRAYATEQLYCGLATGLARHALALVRADSTTPAANAECVLSVAGADDVAAAAAAAAATSAACAAVFASAAPPGAPPPPLDGEHARLASECGPSCARALLALWPTDARVLGPLYGVKVDESSILPLRSCAEERRLPRVPHR